MSNKKTTSLLIIQKSRIQSEPKSSSTPVTNSKRLFSPSRSPKNNQQSKQATYVSKNRFSLFATNETVEPIDQNTNMELDNDQITETKPPLSIFI